MADSQSLIGRTISHYRIIEKLGGGMGVVLGRGRGHNTPSVRGTQVPARRNCTRPTGTGLVPKGSAGGLGAESSKHLHDLRNRRRKRASLYRNGVFGRFHAETPYQIGMPIHDGDKIVCTNSKHEVKLMRIRGTFFDVLRTKLKWGQG